MKRTLISALALTASLSLVACSSTTDTATMETAPEQGTAAATGEVNDANNNPGGVNTALGGTTASGRSGVTNYGGLAGGIPPGTDPNANATTITSSQSTDTSANLTVDASGGRVTSDSQRIEGATGSQFPSSAAGGAGNTRTGGTNTNLNPAPAVSSRVTVRTEPAVTTTTTTTTTTASIDTDNDVDLGVDVDDDDDEVQITTRRMVTKD